MNEKIEKLRGKNSLNEIETVMVIEEYKELYNKYNDLEYKFGCFLCHATGNMMSYTSYELEDMYGVFNEQREQDIQDVIESSSTKLQIAIDALQTAYMSLADCASRGKAPDSYMLTEIKEALNKIERLEDNE